MTAADLKAARQRLGLGPGAMADKLAMTRQNYWRLEQGLQPVRLQVALLVRALETQGRGAQPLEKTS